MANSEQEDILDELVHIYECDEQHVSALIIPTDGEIREDLPVYIEDAESDTIYATTTTDTYGMINTTFSLSPGTHTPTIKCGSNKHNIYDTSVVCHACSLTLTSDKDILSAADGDIATLTATLIGTESGYNGPLSGREVAFEIYQASDDTFIETLTATTNSSGVATVSYSSQGIGDISIVAKVGSLLIQIYEVLDLIKYDDGSSDKSSDYSRINGAVISYDSINKHYTAYNNGSSTFESLMLPLTLPSDVSMELDVMVLGNGSNRQPRFGFSTDNSQGYYTGICWINGGGMLKSYNDSDNVIGTNVMKDVISLNTWFKIKITYSNNTMIVKYCDMSNQVLSSQTWNNITINPVGIAIGLVANQNRIQFKNLKVKPL